MRRFAPLPQLVHRRGARRALEGTLYRSAPPAAESCPIRAIPYAARDNRAPGPMTVWLREQPAAP